MLAGDSEARAGVKPRDHMPLKAGSATCRVKPKQHLPTPLPAQDQAIPELTDAQLDRLLAIAEGRSVGRAGPSVELQTLGLGKLRRNPKGIMELTLTDEGREVLDAIVTPAGGLQVVMKRVGDRWLRRFNDAAPKLAQYFSTEIKKRSDATLKAILKDSGIAVKFQMTPAMKDVMQATIGEQVGLIRSIAQQHLGKVEGLVMRSVQAGRDLGPLAEELQKQFGVTKRRAALIAYHQNNMATATMTRTRRLELGITGAIWQHSGAGKEPRCGIHCQGMRRSLPQRVSGSDAAGAKCRQLLLGGRYGGEG